MTEDGGGIARAGKLSYIQIPAIDAEVSAAFYRDVFGWTIRARRNAGRLPTRAAN